MEDDGFDHSSDFVRVGVKSGGCSGLSYDLKFDKELKESFEPIFEQKPHEDPNSEAAKLGGEISLKAKWLKDSED